METSALVFVGPFATAGAIFLVLVGRSRAAERRRGIASAGGTLRCRAGLSLDGMHMVRGRLEVSGESVTWSPARGRSPITLAGAVPRAAVMAASAGSSRARPDDSVVHLDLPTGQSARLVLHEADAATLVAKLREAPAQASEGPVLPQLRMPLPRTPAWAWVAVVLAVLWLAAWAWLTVIGGEHVVATVTGRAADGMCQVTWTADDGTQERTEIDCGQEKAGAMRDVWATPWPLDHDAGDYAFTNWIVPLVALALFGSAAVGVVRAHWLAHHKPDAVRFAPDRPPLGPVLTEDDLSPRRESAGALLDRLARHANAQLPAHGWEAASRPGGSGSGIDPRQVLRDVAEPVGAAVLVLPMLWSWPFRWPLMAAAVSVGIGIAIRRLAEARSGRRQIAAARRGPARPVLTILACDAADQPVLLLADEVIAPAELWAVPVQTPLPLGTTDAFLSGPVQGTARGRLGEDEAVVVTLTGSSHALLPSSPAWRPSLEELADLLDSAGALDRAYPPMSGRE